MKIEYKCKNEECQHEFKVDYAGGDQWGGGEITPDVCDKCAEDIDFEEIENDALPDPDYYNDRDR